jgi:hypothetical protein
VFRGGSTVVYNLLFEGLKPLKRVLRLNQVLDGGFLCDEFFMKVG